MLNALVRRNRADQGRETYEHEDLAYLVHDIRSVATSVSLMVDLLELAAKAGDDTIQRDRAVSAQSSCNQLAQLCTRIASQMAGAPDDHIEIEKIEVQPLLEEIHEIYSPIFDLTGKSLKLVSGNQRSLIIGDRSQVFRAISNLIDNALKHTSKGSDVIVSQSNYFAQTFICVSDDGSGAAGLEHGTRRSINTLPVVVRHISNSGAVFSPGTGLRYVCETMASHDGDAIAELNERGGSSFSLVFPNR